MSKTEHYNFLVKLFHSAPINQRIFKESVLTLSEGKAQYQLEVKKDYFHGAEALHGAVYFKMLDDAAYFACATLVDDFFLVTKSYEIEFIRPVPGGALTATGKVLEWNEKGFLAESEIINEQGKLVGRGRGEFVKSRKKLSDLIEPS